MTDDYHAVLGLIADHLCAIHRSLEGLNRHAARLELLLTTYVMPHQDELHKAQQALRKVEALLGPAA